MLADRLKRFHGHHVHTRRVRVLGSHLAALVPRGAHVLDIGSGDGLVSALILKQRPDIEMHAIDTIIREKTHIPVALFDGKIIPYPDGALDVVMFVDVLHHTHDPMVLLREATRVASRAVIIKDHTLAGFCAEPILRFMDRLGNEKHGVALPYQYWTRAQWLEAFQLLKVTVNAWNANLGLYPRPANWIFERSLHFVARLDVSNAAR
jgi:SAM-dependent methyltransferase